MAEDLSPASKYRVEIRDARGAVIGDNNVVYQYFLDERYRPLAEHLIAFDELISERIADFVGRVFLDARLAAFMEQHDRGYFVLVGEPGIGKTAWAAHVVVERRALHHFNVSAMGVVRPEQCLENLCAQLIVRYQLDQPYLPVNAGRDGTLLDQLLRWAAERLDGGNLVIVIDALDEAQMPADVRATNTLYLPASLPSGVYCVLTRQPQAVSLQTAPGTPTETFTLGAELPDNQADVRAFLRQQARRPEFATRLADRCIPPERFVEELAERTAGNFMYLAYLLPDIAAGLFDPLNLTRLPQGLRGYYERFWNELESAKGEGREDWTKFYRPVIGMLAAAREPVSAAWIGRILSLEPEEVAEFALTRWCKFLRRTDVAGEARWQLYHASFADFVAEKLNGAKCYHEQIADCYRESSDGNWLTMVAVGGAYGLRYLATHLAGAGRWPDLHDLVAESRDDHLVWAEAHHGLDGAYAGYLADLAIAWGNADDEVVHDVSAMGRQVRYALIKGSIHSSAEGISPELLVALVKHDMRGWTPSSALSYCQAIPDEQMRAECIAALAPTLDARMLREALLAAEALEWAGARVHALCGLIPYLAADQRQAILGQALADAASIRYEPEQTRCRILLLPFLPTQVQLRRSRSLLHRLASPNWDRDRVDLLELLAPRLAPSLQADALDIVQSIENEHECARALVGLAPHLPQELVPWAVTAAEDLEGEYPRWLALAALAPRLSANLREKSAWQVLEAAQKLEEPSHRSEVLATFIAHSGTALSRDVHAEALRARLELYESGQEVRPPLDLIPHLPSSRQQSILADALNSRQSIGDESQQAEMLAALLPYMPSELRQEAIARILEIARYSDWDDERVRLSSAVIPFLEQPERKRELASLLKLAKSIFEDDPEVDGVAAMARVVPHLSRRLRKEVIEMTFETARGIGHNGLRARGLAALVPVLPRALRIRTVDELLDLAENIRNEFERVEILSNLVPYLSTRQTRKVLFAVREMRNEQARAEVLAKVASNLPDSLIPQAVATAETIADESDLSRILCAIAKYQHTDNASDALAQATASAQLWWDAEPRAKALEGLIPAWLRLIEVNRAQALQLFTVQLRQMAARSRYDLLSDLRVFIPVVVALAGQEVAIDLARGTLDVGRWWP